MAETDRIFEAQRKWQAIPITDEISCRNFAADSLAKCSEAIIKLGENLNELGYQWAKTERLSAEHLKRNIAKVEQSINLTVPSVLTMFWEGVGSVSLVDLKNYQHVNFWKEHNVFSLHGYCDGLHIDVCNDAWASFVSLDHLDWKENEPLSSPDDFVIRLSPDGYHKDNISGGEAYGVRTTLTWKPVWENFKWSGVKRPVSAISDKPDFLSYLRTSILECAGFPALFGLHTFEPIRNHLLRDVPLF